jgi:uncharacterized protein (DUF885 family)
MKFLGLVFVLLFASAAHAAPSAGLAALLHDYDEAHLKLYPTDALWRGDRRYLDRYEDTLTPEFLVEARKENADFRARLARISRASLDGEDALSYDIFAWQLDGEARLLAPGIAERFQMLPLDQFGGAQVYFATEMEWRGRFPFNTPEQYRQAISRMKGFAHWMDTAIARMRDGMKTGVTLPSAIVVRVIPQAEEQANKPIDDSVFMGPVANMPDTIKGADRARIAAAYRQTVADAVIPAYRRLADFLKNEYLAKARDSVGLSAVPGGHEMYIALVRHHTTEETTPEDFRRIGLEEVARIKAQMERVKDKTGFKGDLAAFRAFLRNDPRFKFKSRDEMMAAYRAVKAKIAHGLPRAFDRLPKTPFEIRFFDDFQAPAQAAANYEPASADGSRPGIFNINGYDLPSRPTYTTEVLSLHESMPGHHLQMMLAQENTSLPAFRRFNGPNAFIEGWGLYAEQLGKALGLYTDPYQEFGFLSFDMWRACRLVVDTGMHNGTMTRDEAIRFMLDNTALTRTDVEAEVDRYIAYPGQALAYKAGELDLLRLRDKAEARLGTGFDLRKFHDAVLLGGAMPLPVLEAQIDRWIAAQAGNHNP